MFGGGSESFRESSRIGGDQEMEWREAYLNCFGPGMIGGITFGRWLRLLRENRFSVAPSCLPRALAITCQSMQNSVFQWIDRHRLRSSLNDLEVPPPLFVLGHWRNGTTHLHNLLAVDMRFAYPNNYQALFPATFLTAESLHSRAIEFFLPKRRPMDNMEWTMHSPQEDEFALCISTFKSPCMGWVFPRRRDHYAKYLTFREVSHTEINEWKEGLLWYLKKLTWKLKRPLILKSPPHTCRIKLLLELFPQAKFVHIHRNPYDVFPSSRRTFEVSFQMHGLQRPPAKDLDGWILNQYREMYEAFFDQRDLIPKGHFFEVGFEELERDPIGHIQRLYHALSLADFAHTKQALESYVRSIDGYQKNRFPKLNPELRRRIAEAWRPCFEQWSYPVDRPAE